MLKLLGAPTIKRRGTMNWDASGAIGQGASALALLFVVIQIGHTPWYEVMKAHLNPDAASYVDALLAQPG